jgi:DNA polymerase
MREFCAVYNLRSWYLADQRSAGHMPVIHLHLDFETRSPLDIRRVGLDRYARSAEVLMMAWAVNDQPPQIWLPSESVIPEQLEVLLMGGWGGSGVVPIAWNAAFERAILTHCLGIASPVEQWIDPSVIARYAGLPGKLALVSEFLKLGDKGKDKEGSRLINKFSKPHKSKKLGEHFKDWRDPKHAEDWLKFQAYCRQDVVAEREIFHRLRGFFDLPEKEWRLWYLDAKINERGMPVSMPFVRNAQRIVDAELGSMQKQLNELTGLANANSGQQLLPWLRARGYPFSSLAKERVTKALEG